MRIPDDDPCPGCGGKGFFRQKLYPGDPNSTLYEYECAFDECGYTMVIDEKEETPPHEKV